MAFIIRTLKIRKCPTICTFMQSKNYGKFIATKNLAKWYNILGIPDDSDQEKIRVTYLNLVKKFHPDSGSAQADSIKFQEIDQAFRILINKKSRERWDIEEINIDEPKDEEDIKYTPAQYRHYLSFGGYGYGPPMQREKQFSKIRAMHALENVTHHRLQKATAEEKAVVEKRSQAHKIRTKSGFDRLVEDLIQQSMSNGEFDNLSGSGKPLKHLQGCNPYVDFTTHKLNQVLIDNGFTPEWITLQKEIRENKKSLLSKLYRERSTLGEYPFNPQDNVKWNKIIKFFTNDQNEINLKIEKYNFVVPLLEKQMFRISIEKEAEKIAQYGQTRNDLAILRFPEKNEGQDNPQNIFSFLESFLSKMRS